MSATPPPLVSVAVAAFDARDHIGAAVASALGQTMRAIEVIVVDDCSRDDTLDILAPLAAADARLRIERLAANGGPAAARNRALELAKGRWFAVLDADDLYAPDRLERLVAAAERDGADFVADDLVVFTDGAPETARRHIGAKQSATQLELGNYLTQSRLFGGGSDLGFLKPIIALDRLRAAGLRYDETLRIGEDDDLVVRMLLAGFRYRIEPEPLYAYRKHPASISHRLLPAAARAMAVKGAALAHAHAARPEALALDRRARSFRYAQAFVELVEALKRRDAIGAARIALAHPAALPLLRMPLVAKLGRIAGSPAPPADPLAQAALNRILASMGSKTAGAAR